MSSYLNVNSNMVHVTEKGFSRLKQHVIDTEKRYLDVYEQRRVAHDLSGDGWHDNPEFNRQQQMEAFLNIELKRLLQSLDQARVFVVQDGCRPVERVWLGSVVDINIVDDETGDEVQETWEITGHGESDQQRRMLAYDAPLAKAILPLEPQDWADEISLRGRMVSIEVVKLYDQRQQSSLGAT